MRRKASSRELIAPRGNKRYIRRDERGRIKESDDVGRSLAQDRRRKAKTVAKAGQVIAVTARSRARKRRRALRNALAECRWPAWG